jgi:hypothetical protein
MKVWLVWMWDEGERHLSGIYDSEEKAENNRYSIYCDIEEREVQ